MATGEGLPPFCLFFQRLTQIGNQIVCLFDPHGQADQLRHNAVSQTLLARNRGVGSCCRADSPGLSHRRDFLRG